MQQEVNFSQGKILGPLVRFALPVLAALFLQSMYGAVDLLVVGQFSAAADVSAVATGAQIMLTLTNLISALAMGLTIILGQQIGRGERKKGGETIGAGIMLFFVAGLILTALMAGPSALIAQIMHAPAEAFDLTVAYVRICGGGAIVIIAYNLIGSIFRGLGDSRTPLITVAIACVANIAGDLLLVAGLGLGAAGAAIATVGAQAVSVVISLALIRRRTLPFLFSLSDIRWHRPVIRKILSLGVPIAFSDLLVGISFLIITAIVNALGVIPSAGIGVAERICGFIMLVPSSFMQSLAAFVAQNVGAGRFDRAIKTLRYGIGLSLCAGLFMGWLAFFHGDLLSGIFAHDPQIIAASYDYLKAYGIDCLLTAFLFCFIGFFNGIGMTRFVMLQGIVSAFLIRVPVSYLMSRQDPVSLFHIGLATPCSSAVQIIMCLIAMYYVRKKVIPHCQSSEKSAR